MYLCLTRKIKSNVIRRFDVSNIIIKNGKTLKLLKDSSCLTNEYHLMRFNCSKLNSFNNFDINVFPFSPFLIMMLDISKRRITLLLIFLLNCFKEQLTIRYLCL